MEKFDTGGEVCFVDLHSGCISGLKVLVAKTSVVPQRSVRVTGKCSEKEEEIHK